MVTLRMSHEFRSFKLIGALVETFRKAWRELAVQGKHSGGFRRRAKRDGCVDCEAAGGRIGWSTSR